MLVRLWLCLFVNTQLVSLLKDLRYNFISPNVVYNLQKSITSSISNFKKFVSNINVDQFSVDSPNIVCNCENLPFSDSYDGHIVTSDLGTLKDNMLKKLFTKDPKYREPRKIDFDQARENIANGIEDFILTWSQKHKISDAILLESKNKVMELVNNKMITLKVQITKIV